MRAALSLLLVGSLVAVISAQCTPSATAPVPDGIDNDCDERIDEEICSPVVYPTQKHVGIGWTWSFLAHQDDEYLSLIDTFTYTSNAIAASVCLWFKTGLEGNTDGFNKKYLYNYGSESKKEVAAYVECKNDGQVKGKLSIYILDSESKTAEMDGVCDNLWHHACFVWDTVQGSETFLDGRSVDSDDGLSTGDEIPADGIWYFGRKLEDDFSSNPPSGFHSAHTFTGHLSVHYDAELACFNNYGNVSAVVISLANIQTLPTRLSIEEVKRHMHKCFIQSDLKLKIIPRNAFQIKKISEDHAEVTKPEYHVFNAFDSPCKGGYAKNCVVGQGLTYAGEVSVTTTGVACVNWADVVKDGIAYHDSEFIDKSVAKAGNKCRNPLRSVWRQGDFPWCHINTDGDTGVCDIPLCNVEPMFSVLVYRKTEDSGIVLQNQEELSSYKLDVCSWFKTIYSAAGNFMDLFRFYDGNNDNWGIRLEKQTDRTGYGKVYTIASDNSITEVSVNLPIFNGQWHLLCVDADTKKVYLDDEEIGSADSSAIDDASASGRNLSEGSDFLCYGCNINGQGANVYEARLFVGSLGPLYLWEPTEGGLHVQEFRYLLRTRNWLWKTPLFFLNSATVTTLGTTPQHYVNSFMGGYFTSAMLGTCTPSDISLTMFKGNYGKAESSNCSTWSSLMPYQQFSNGVDAQNSQCRALNHWGYLESDPFVCKKSNGWFDCKNSNYECVGDIASGKPVEQSTTDGSHTADLAVDGDLTTYTSTTSDGPSWWRVDLLVNYAVATVSFLPEDSSVNYMQLEVWIETASNFKQWCDEYAVDLSDDNLFAGVFRDIHCAEKPIGRYVNVSNTIDDKILLHEVKVFGVLDETFDLDGDGQIGEDCNYAMVMPGWSEWSPSSQSCTSEICGFGPAIVSSRSCTADATNFNFPSLCPNSQEFIYRKDPNCDKTLTCGVDMPFSGRTRFRSLLDNGAPDDPQLIEDVEIIAAPKGVGPTTVARFNGGGGLKFTHLDEHYQMLVQGTVTMLVQFKDVVAGELFRYGDTDGMIMKVSSSTQNLIYLSFTSFTNWDDPGTIVAADEWVFVGFSYTPISDANGPNQLYFIMEIMKQDGTQYSYNSTLGLNHMPFYDTNNPGTHEFRLGYGGFTGYMSCFKFLETFTDKPGLKELARGCYSSWELMFKVSSQIPLMPTTNTWADIWLDSTYENEAEEDALLSEPRQPYKAAIANTWADSDEIDQLKLVLLDQNGMVLAEVTFDVSHLVGLSASVRRAQFMSFDKVLDAYPWTDLAAENYDYLTQGDYVTLRSLFKRQFSAIKSKSGCDIEGWFITNGIGSCEFDEFAEITAPYIFYSKLTTAANFVQGNGDYPSGDLGLADSLAIYYKCVGRRCEHSHTTLPSSAYYRPEAENGAQACGFDSWEFSTGPSKHNYAISADVVSGFSDSLEITCCLWLQFPSQLPSTKFTVLNYFTSSQKNQIWVTMLRDGNGIKFHPIMDGGWSYYVYLNTDVDDGMWHHLCWTAVQHTPLKVYIDGRLDVEQTGYVRIGGGLQALETGGYLTIGVHINSWSNDRVSSTGYLNTQTATYDPHPTVAGKYAGITFWDSILTVDDINAAYLSCGEGFWTTSADNMLYASPIDGDLTVGFMMASLPTFGCWVFPSDGVESLEGKGYSVLSTTAADRSNDDAKMACYSATLSETNNELFFVQEKECYTTDSAMYQKLGPSEACADGVGGANAMNAYEINKVYNRYAEQYTAECLPCFDIEFPDSGDSYITYVFVCVEATAPYSGYKVEDCPMRDTMGQTQDTCTPIYCEKECPTINSKQTYWFYNRCLWVEPDTVGNWGTGCSDFGDNATHLIIKSEAEQEAIAAFFTDHGISRENDYWLGLKLGVGGTATNEADYYWQDGTQVVNGNWDSNGPESGKDTAVLKDSGLWDAKSTISDTKDLNCQFYHVSGSANEWSIWKTCDNGGSSVCGNDDTHYRTRDCSAAWPCTPEQTANMYCEDDGDIGVMGDTTTGSFCMKIFQSSNGNRHSQWRNECEEMLFLRDSTLIKMTIPSHFAEIQEHLDFYGDHKFAIGLGRVCDDDNCENWKWYWDDSQWTETGSDYFKSGQTLNGDNSLYGYIDCSEDCLIETESSSYNSNYYVCMYEPSKDGIWASWESWQDCDGDCVEAPSKVYRERTCTNPAPAPGGQDCPGDTTQESSLVCGDGVLAIVAGFCVALTTTENDGDSTQCATEYGSNATSLIAKTEAIYNDVSIIFDQTSNSIWVGMVKSSSGSSYVWIDGTPYSGYLGSVSTSYSDSSDDCVKIRQGRYYRDDCSESKPIACMYYFIPANDGNWASWEPWQDCDGDCVEAASKVYRERTCTDPAPDPGGQNCSGDATQESPLVCGDGVPTIVGEFCVALTTTENDGDSSQCATEYGSNATSLIAKTEAIYNDVSFIFDHTSDSIWVGMVKSSSGSSYVWIDGTPYSEYLGSVSTSYSDSSDDCVKIRQGRYYRDDCSESKPIACMYYPITVDGGWTDWTDWLVCDSNCTDVNAIRYKYRSCTNPPPAGGAACSGDSILEDDTNYCNTGTPCINGDCESRGPAPFYICTCHDPTDTSLTCTKVNCMSLLNANSTSNTYDLDLVGDGVTASFSAYCDMSTFPPRTILQTALYAGVSYHEDSRVDNDKSFTVDAHLDIEDSQMDKLIESAGHCRQKLIFGCQESDLSAIRYETHRGTHVDGTDWQCECSVVNMCSSSGDCKCMDEISEYKADTMTVTDFSKLPIDRLKIGDADDSEEYVTVAVGPLECYTGYLYFNCYQWRVAGLNESGYYRFSDGTQGYCDMSLTDDELNSLAPAEWFEEAQAAFWFSDGTFTLETARAKCAEDGGVIASILSDAERDYLKTLPGYTSSNSPLIGLSTFFWSYTFYTGTTVSSTWSNQVRQMVVDGLYASASNFWAASGASATDDSWIRLDLYEQKVIGWFGLWFRNNCCPERHVRIFVLASDVDEDPNPNDPDWLELDYQADYSSSGFLMEKVISPTVNARYISVYFVEQQYGTIAELFVSDGAVTKQAGMASSKFYWEDLTTEDDYVSWAPNQPVYDASKTAVRMAANGFENVDPASEGDGGVFCMKRIPESSKYDPNTTVTEQTLLAYINKQLAGIDLRQAVNLTLDGERRDYSDCFDTPCFTKPAGQVCDWYSDGCMCTNGSTTIILTCANIDIVTRGLTPGGYSAWTPWADCAGNCDDPNSVVKRTRQCDNPVPLHSAMNCTEEYFQESKLKCPGYAHHFINMDICFVETTTQSGCKPARRTICQEAYGLNATIAMLYTIEMYRELEDFMLHQSAFKDDSDDTYRKIWSGLTYVDGQFQWRDGTELGYNDTWTNGPQATNGIYIDCTSGDCLFNRVPCDSGSFHTVCMFNIVVGAWSDWSPVVTCDQRNDVRCGGKKYIRTRECDSPDPETMGVPCDGSDFFITNIECLEGSTHWFDDENNFLGCIGVTELVVCTQASDSCKAEFGDSAQVFSLYSEAHQLSFEAIRTRITNEIYIWLGLAIENGAYVWQNGSALTYSNWHDSVVVMALTGSGVESSVVIKCDPANDIFCDWIPFQCAVPTLTLCVYEQVDGMWSEWNEWVNCTSSISECGPKALRYRNRTCDNPEPALGGTSCNGDEHHTSELNCEEGSWLVVTALDEFCWFFMENGTTADDGDTICQIVTDNSGASMANPMSLEHIEALHWITEQGSFESDDTKKYFIGLTYNASRSTHIWSLVGGTIGDSDWSRGHPITQLSIEGVPTETHCVALDGTDDWKWVSVPCEDTHYALCSYGLDIIDGGWSPYGEWSDCDAWYCSSGNRTRERTCDSPEPQNGGAYCDEPHIDVSLCFNNSCPINGNWAEWTPWSNCTRFCRRTRSRECTDPEPMYFGEDCIGDANETAFCRAKPCELFLEAG